MSREHRSSQRRELGAQPSSSSFNRRRSASLALRIARAMTGAVIAANPEGSPALRSVILVAAPAVSSHVYVVSIGKGPCEVAITKRRPGSTSLTS